MTHFDETAEYWGNKQAMIIDHNRLTARSVKIFADGCFPSIQRLVHFFLIPFKQVPCGQVVQLYGV